MKRFIVCLLLAVTAFMCSIIDHSLYTAAVLEHAINSSVDEYRLLSAIFGVMGMMCGLIAINVWKYGAGIWGQAIAATWVLSKHQVIQFIGCSQSAELDWKNGQIDLEIAVMINNKLRCISVSLTKDQVNAANKAGGCPFSKGYWYRYTGWGEIEPLPIGAK